MKRKYFRKCGYCGRRLEQSHMIRTDIVRNGWLCKECYHDEAKYVNFTTDTEDLLLRAGAEDF